ncbi:hypothetical protein AB205_0102950 [Aquarana catesbeiana]|uniref:Uncharacterized protein n=1 Tax=Aquarana catesbeiana TaxID=8400 RepID=A0A2G9Q6K2_AQUCT|nr:hypothetical protein AB205_0102950 [Aquarana catesbeiana]
MQTRFCVRRGHSAAVTLLDTGALVWDTRTPFLLGGPTQVLQCIL